MGLFSKTKESAVEQEVLEGMVTSELLNYLINQLCYHPDAAWMKSAQWGDNGWRTVTVKPSGFIIEIPGAYERRDLDHFVAFNFESSGYNSLQAHYNNRGKKDISRSRMCYLYATALHRRLSAALPHCEFYRVNNDRDMSQLSDDNLLFALDLMMDAGSQATFDYRVPVPATKNLY